MKTKSTPLLELLNFRWEQEVKYIPDPTWNEPFKRPHFTPAEQDRLRQAARLHAQANNSDPFAYGRIVRAMRHGYATISEVRDEALKQIGARTANGIVIPIAGAA